MPYPRRVVLTGLGVISPIGNDLRAFRASLCDRTSGVRRITTFDPSGLPVQIAGEVQSFDPKDYLDKKDRKSLKMMARTVQFAVAGARLALDDAQLSTTSHDPSRAGVSFGVGTIPGDISLECRAAYASHDHDRHSFDIRRWGSDGMAQLQPMWMLNHVPNMASCHVSILHNAQGPNNTIVQSDAASLLAICEAVNVIQRDSADVMFAGGADSRTQFVPMVRYPLFTQVSRRNDEPEIACRPFDRAREGQVLGEGAGILLLEELDHARSRGARIYAEVIGSASGFDTRRSGKGFTHCVKTALSRAGIAPDELDHINAHAPGTTCDDEWEAKALKNALGDFPVPVVAMKSFFGNLGTGSSAVEMIASLLALADGCRPGTLNHDETDPDCPVLVARDSGKVQKPCVLKTACTDRGQCVAMVLKRWEA